MEFRTGEYMVSRGLKLITRAVQRPLEGQVIKFQKGHMEWQDAESQIAHETCACKWCVIYKVLYIDVLYECV